MDDIYNQSGFVLRNENSYSPNIVDDRLPIAYEKEEISGNVQTTYGTPLVDSAVNVTFSFSSFYTNWVIDCLSTIDSQIYAQLNPPTKMPLYPKIASNKVAHNLLYAVDSGVMTSFTYGIFKDSSLASYVNSFILYPFDVTSVTLYTSGERLTIHNKELDYSDDTFKNPSNVGTHVSTNLLLNATMGYVVVSDFTITPQFSDNESFLNYEPYSKYEFYIPFIGWIELKSIDILSKRIIIYYGIDVSTGTATCYVKQYSTQKTLYSAPCQIGIKLPINTSNAEILTREKQNNNLNMILGLISSGVSIGIGAVKGNPIAMVGGVLSGGKAIASYINAKNMMIEQAQTSFASSESIAYDDIQQVRFRFYHSKVITIDDDVYSHIQGYPVNQYDALTSFSGYTEIPEMHYYPQSQTNITKTEIDEIISLARKGIIL